MGVMNVIEGVDPGHSLAEDIGIRPQRWAESILHPLLHLATAVGATDNEATFFIEGAEPENLSGVNIRCPWIHQRLIGVAGEDH